MVEFTRALPNWCDATTSIATAVGLLGAVVGALIALIQSKRDKDVRRAEFLNQLIDKFTDSDAQSLLAVADSDDEGDGWFADVTSDMAKKRKTDLILMFFSRLCYLYERKLIAGEEFRFFADQLEALLSNRNVMRYLIDENDTLKMSFGSLIDYAKRRHLAEYDDLVGYLKTRLAERTVIEEGKCVSRIVIIRISRLYHDGMTSEAVYEATRGHWKARFETIKDAKTVISVADGLVKGVYDVEQWYNSGESDGFKTAEQDRVMFKGHDTVDPEKQKWIGRSLKCLFTKGAANPVRYTTLKEITDTLTKGGAK